MPAKPIDLQKLLRAHIEAQRCCRQWAEKAIELREVGRFASAREAERKAKYWTRRLILVERQMTKTNCPPRFMPLPVSSEESPFAGVA